MSRPNRKTRLVHAFILISNICLAKVDNHLVSRQKHRPLSQNSKNYQPLLQPKSKVPLTTIRGGQSPPSDPYTNHGDYGSHPNHKSNPEDGLSNFIPPDDFTNTEHLFQESVQDRVDQWRQAQLAQQQKLSSQSPLEEANPRDSQGRLKLFGSVSKASRALIFFVMMWRNIHLYELADQDLKGVFRNAVVIPLILLFIGNMAGVVASFTSPSHSNKKRLKAILNLDKLVEGVLLVYYFIRLTVVPPKHIPREVFVAKTLHSVLFLAQLQAFTRVNWEEVISGSSGGTKQARDTAYPLQPETVAFSADSDQYITRSGDDPMYDNNPAPYDYGTDPYSYEDNSGRSYY